MSAFPSLAVSPTLPIPDEPIDSTIRSSSEAGYETTRPRFTRRVRQFGPIKYAVLLQSEKDLIQALDDDVGGWSLFTWTHPKNGTTHNVRFAEGGRPKFELVAPAVWACTFTLKEA